MKRTLVICLTLVLLLTAVTLPAGAVVTRRGDISGDGRLTVLDALQTLTGILRGDSMTNVDMNGDGVVSLLDILRMCRYASAGDSFTQNTRLFAPSKSGIYNYCPSVMQTADGNTRYIYYCTNQASKIVTDYIGCRVGTKQANGTFSYGAESIVLSPTSATWDARHTCDPSVIAGTFEFGGENYGYLMAYLGCTSNDNQDNEIGFAVAKSPTGPFVKIASTPTIAYVRDGDDWQWGVGQASLVSADKAGQVYVFYTEGTSKRTHEFVDLWDFSDADAPERLSHTDLKVTGLKNMNNNTDYIANADFAYDPDSNSYYMAIDAHPYPSDTPDYIAGSFRVAYFNGTNLASPSWKSLEVIGSSETGRLRNHNVGLVRDMYGHLPTGNSLTVIYTGNTNGSNALWDYRLYEYTICK